MIDTVVKGSLKTLSLFWSPKMSRCFLCLYASDMKICGLGEARQLKALQSCRSSQKSSLKTAKLGRSHLCGVGKRTDGRLPHALGSFKCCRPFLKTMSIVLHFFAFLNGRSRNNNNNNMKNIHMVTYRVQSDARVGGSQAHQGGTTLKMLGRWNVEFDSPSFHKQISPRNLDEALTIGACHVTCLMRCLVIDVISLGPVQMSNENHRASANCLVFSFDLLKFECADTFSRRQRCWSLPWLLSWNMSPRPQRFSFVNHRSFTLAEAGRAGGHKARLRNVWWEHCRKTSRKTWNWNPRSEEGAKLSMVEYGW